MDEVSSETSCYLNKIVYMLCTKWFLKASVPLPKCTTCVLEQIIAVHLPVHTGRNNFQCCKCGKRHHYYSCLSHHRKMSGCPSKGHPCLKCGYIFHGKKDRSGSIIPCKKKKFQCSKCGIKFWRNATLQAHMSNGHIVKKHQHPMCKKQLKEHTVVHQKSRRPRVRKRDVGEQAWQPSKKLLFESDLKHHMKLRRRLECGKCSMPRQQQLAPADAEVHTQSEKKFECTTCGNTYQYRTALLTHQKLHNASHRNYRCLECGKLFHSVYYLRMHVTEIHDHKKTKCVKCGDYFSNIVRHTEEVHSSKAREKEFLALQRCTLCGKRIYDVRTHLKWHLKIPDHQWRSCGKKFSLRSEVKFHARKRPKTCRKQYTGDDSVLKTQTEIQNGKFLKCLKCKKPFPTVLELITHHSTCQGNKISEHLNKNVGNDRYTIEQEATKKKDTNGQKCLKCLKCKKTFPSISELFSHRSRCQGNKISEHLNKGVEKTDNRDSIEQEGTKKKDTNDQKCLKCLKCKKPFPTISELFSHRSRCQGKISENLNKGVEKTDNRDSIEQEATKKKDTNGQKCLKCLKCKQPFPTISELFAHRSRCQGKISENLNKGVEKTDNRDAIEQEATKKKDANGQKCLKCLKCKQPFPTVSELFSHRSRCQGKISENLNKGVEKTDNRDSIEKEATKKKDTNDQKCLKCLKCKKPFPTISELFAHHNICQGNKIPEHLNKDVGRTGNNRGTMEWKTAETKDTNGPSRCYVVDSDLKLLNQGNKVIKNLNKNEETVENKFIDIEILNEGKQTFPFPSKTKPMAENQYTVRQRAYKCFKCKRPFAVLKDQLSHTRKCTGISNKAEQTVTLFRTKEKPKVDKKYTAVQKIYNCVKCKLCFLNRLELLNHSRECAGNPNQEKPTVKNSYTNRQEGHKCVNCKQVFPTILELLDHYNTDFCSDIAGLGLAHVNVEVAPVVTGKKPPVTGKKIVENLSLLPEMKNNIQASVKLKIQQNRNVARRKLPSDSSMTKSTADEQKKYKCVGCTQYFGSYLEILAHSSHCFGGTSASLKMQEDEQRRSQNENRKSQENLHPVPGGVVSWDQSFKNNNQTSIMSSKQYKNKKRHRGLTEDSNLKKRTKIGRKDTESVARWTKSLPVAIPCEQNGSQMEDHNLEEKSSRMFEVTGCIQKKDNQISIDSKPHTSLEYEQSLSLVNYEPKMNSDAVNILPRIEEAKMGCDNQSMPNNNRNASDSKPQNALECGQSFSIMNLKHRAVVRNGRKSYPCVRCNQHFSSILQLLDHSDTNKCPGGKPQSAVKM